MAPAKQLPAPLYHVVIVLPIALLLIVYLERNQLKAMIIDPSSQSQLELWNTNTTIASGGSDGSGRSWPIRANGSLTKNEGSEHIQSSSDVLKRDTIKTNTRPKRTQQQGNTKHLHHMHHQQLKTRNRHHIAAADASRSQGVVNGNKFKLNKSNSTSYLSQHDYIYQRLPWDASPIVIEKYKLIFFTIPKVGCTVFKQLFRRMDGYQNWNKLGGSSSLPHDPRYNGLKYLYHYSLADATDMMLSTTNNWTKAIFVRDPRERLVSAYLDKAVRKGGVYVSRHCCPTCGEQAKSSLFDFLQVMQKCIDPHWMPQSHRMEQRFWDAIDYVGHIETAVTDAKVLLEFLGAWQDHGVTGWGTSGTESIFQSLSNVKHKTNAKDQFYQYFGNSTETEALVNEYYKDDYANEKLGFNQSFTSYN